MANSASKHKTPQWRNTKNLNMLSKLSLRWYLWGTTSRIATWTTPKHKNMTTTGKKIHTHNLALRHCPYKNNQLNLLGEPVTYLLFPGLWVRHSYFESWFTGEVEISLSCATPSTSNITIVKKYNSCLEGAQPSPGASTSSTMCVCQISCVCKWVCV